MGSLPVFRCSASGRYRLQRGLFTVAALLLVATTVTANVAPANARDASASHARSFDASSSALPLGTVGGATSGDTLRLAQYMSNICATPYGSCYMGGFGPIGSQCWCPSPNGPIRGVVR
jgi:hypothetical protein